MLVTRLQLLSIHLLLLLLWVLLGMLLLWWVLLRMLLLLLGMLLVLLLGMGLHGACLLRRLTSLAGRRAGRLVEVVGRGLWRGVGGRVARRGRGSCVLLNI